MHKYKYTYITCIYIHISIYPSISFYIYIHICFWMIGGNGNRMAMVVYWCILWDDVASNDMVETLVRVSLMILVF